MKTVAMLSLCAALTLPLPYLAVGQSASPAPPPSETKNNTTIAGDWTVHFKAAGQTVPGKLHLEVEGEQLTGTIETTHTGPGTFQNGKWSHDGKLTATLVFAHHESILFEGDLKPDGTLAGKYQTEGRTETWQAEKRQTSDSSLTNASSTPDRKASPGLSPGR